MHQNKSMDDLMTVLSGDLPQHIVQEATDDSKSLLSNMKTMRSEQTQLMNRGKYMNITIVKQSVDANILETQELNHTLLTRIQQDHQHSRELPFIKS